MEDEKLENCMDNKIILNVYGLSSLNKYLEIFGMGCYHTGVQVYGLEFNFGGSDCEGSGIFVTYPREIETIDQNITFCKAICVGRTDLSLEEVHKIVKSSGLYFQSRSYDLLKKNCNHFSETFIKALGSVQSFPKWINRIANVVKYVPWIVPSNLKVPQTHLDN